MEDHPRMGGEKYALMVDWRVRVGSPPHGRGKVCFEKHSARLARITPAWAGKRLPCTVRCTARKDHPRMGGEKSMSQNKPKK